MKKLILMVVMASLSLAAMAQHEEDTENGVVSLAGREGFTIETKKGDFVFKPYLLVQTCANFNWYDDEGLDKAYNQDNIANSGFSIPYAVLGFTGKAFGKVAFNLSIKRLPVVVHCFSKHGSMCNSKNNLQCVSVSSRLPLRMLI